MMTDIAYAEEFRLNEAGIAAVLETLKREEDLGGRALSASTQEETLELNNFLSEALGAATKVATATLITALTLVAM
jgi:hypothetical protein